MHLKFLETSLAFLGNGFFHQKVQLSGGRVSFDLLVPFFPVPLGKPGTRTRVIFMRKKSDCEFYFFHRRHDERDPAS